MMIIKYVVIPHPPINGSHNYVSYGNEGYEKIIIAIIIIIIACIASYLDGYKK